jgi:RNA polymerase sigma-70 factor (ECF subfamily)
MVIIRCRQGDEEAWRLLLARYEAYVYRLCFWIIGSREVALDLTQEAFMKVLTGLNRFQLGLPLKPWLRQVTVNACLNFLRRRAPETVFLEQPVAEGIVLGDTLAGKTDEPVAAAQWRVSIIALKNPKNLAICKKLMNKILRVKASNSNN